ncbi:MAG: hypothetical protein V1676_01245 [Candidatus Diapherotrites archaeon]
MAEKIIDKIYFITHPAHTFIATTRTPQQAARQTNALIETVLNPLIKNVAQNEPNSLVVLVKSGIPTR